jgi:hypothetical protein
MRLAATITAVAPWVTQNDARILERLCPPVLWSTAPSVSMAERDVLGVKIPTEGRLVV